MLIINSEFYSYILKLVDQTDHLQYSYAWGSDWYDYSDRSYIEVDRYDHIIHIHTVNGCAVIKESIE